MKRSSNYVASAGVLLLWMIWTTSSMLSQAMMSPSKMWARSWAFQVILCTTDSNIVTVLNKYLTHSFRASKRGRPLTKNNAVHWERTLTELSSWTVCSEWHWHWHLFYIDDDTHSLTAWFIIRIGNTLKFALFNQIGNIFNELSLVYSIGNFGDNNLIMTLITLDLAL